MLEALVNLYALYCLIVIGGFFAVLAIKMNSG